MAKQKKKYWLVLGAVVFIVYVFAAAQPISRETVLVSRWLTSLENNYPVNLGGESVESREKNLLIPFELGGRFGYVGDDGVFAINQMIQTSQSQNNYAALSPERWTRYEAVPSSVEIRDPRDQLLLEIEDPQGYPFFLDGRIFILGKDGTSLRALNDEGVVLWTYDFPAPLTCIDAASGFVLAGTLDGTVELLNSEGRQVIPPFEPGGSRLAVIAGCAISGDGSRLAVISGVDDQRFLLLEQAGDRYRVVYHEFLSDGFRRPVYISFVSNDSRVIFECEDGVGIYDIASRTSVKAPLKGEIAALDESGADGIFFVISSQGPEQKWLTAIRYPRTIVMEAPFKSKSSFFTRRSSRIYIGGNMTLISLELEKK